jgi:hypothetical protein
MTASGMPPAKVEITGIFNDIASRIVSGKLSAIVGSIKRSEML